MLVFLDFEASSLSKRSYPIEVGWVFEDGQGEDHLIRPAPEWNDWDPAAEGIHRITRQDLSNSGTDHAVVARRMVDVLSGHDLCASAPSWDGKWLSTLLRAAQLPRHALRLRSTADVRRAAARTILAEKVAPDRLEQVVEGLLALQSLDHVSGAPAHRALADAEQERQRWLRVQHAARSELLKTAR